jgi:hypothetical protein
MKLKLPLKTLSQIWHVLPFFLHLQNLTSWQGTCRHTNMQCPRLSRILHLIMVVMGGQLDSTPTSLPAGLCKQASSGRSVHVWDITPALKVASDRLFNSLDTKKNNYIQGDVATSLLQVSNLSEVFLAMIWYLFDLSS